MPIYNVGEDIDRLFNASNGDLLYGSSKIRETCMKTCPKIKEAIECGAWITIDTYNDNSIKLFSYLFDPNAANFENKGQDDIIRTLKKNVDKSHPWNTLGSTLKKTNPDQYEEIMQQNIRISEFKSITEKKGEQYLDGLAKQYPFKNVRSLTTENLQKSGGTLETHGNKMIRQACKFGIENIIKSMNGAGRIHFIIDERLLEEKAIINKEPVVNEKNETHVVITLSELRYVFRNWERLKYKVVFYKKDFKSCPAPWEGKSEPWVQYAKNRLKKYIDRAIEMNADQKQFDKYLNVYHKNLTTMDFVKELIDAADEICIFLNLKPYRDY